MKRRSFLQKTAGLCAGAGALAVSRGLSAQAPGTSVLKQAARRSGKILGMFTGQHQLLFEPMASSIITDNFSMIAVGNDLKFSNRLRPTPDTYDFSYGDTDVSWAEYHGLLFRGHCLIWWNALPNWFQSYVNAGNARRVMTDHITGVVKHYAGRMYSWDVVNECIYHDNRPDGLRRKPWLDLVGPDYIDLAFHTAAAADPRARLILNECYIEHDTPAEIGRRASLLALATRLKQSSVPITGIGIQGHLRGNTPLDHAGMIVFMKQVRDLGLEIMVTELDVDDVGVAGPLIQQTVADKYEEFLTLVSPYVKVITFEGVRNDPAMPKRPDGLPHLANIYDENYRGNAAFDAVVKSLQKSNR